MLRRAAFAVLAALLATSAGAQTTQSGAFCGPTGFNVNLALTTKSFRCALSKMLTGTGTLTLVNTTALTGTAGSFANIQTPDAVPGADDISFKTSGIQILLAGQTYYLQVVTKTSDTVLVVNMAGGNPGLTGTVTRWGYWNTLCRRSSQQTTAFDAALSATGTGQLWGSDSALRSSDGTGVTGNLQGLCWAPAAGAASQVSFYNRPQGLGALLNATATDYTNGTCPTALGAKIGTPSGVSLKGQELQATAQSTAANAWPVACIIVSAK